jgi:hypothetical protein
MRGVMRATMRLAWTAAILLTALIPLGCGTATESATPASSAEDPGIVAEVASYQLVADQPGRLLVALVTADGRWLSFGSVGVSFSYLGTDATTAPPDAVLPDAPAMFLPIPGSPEGDGQAATLTFAADGRGVYAITPITFPTAGYWRLVASGELGDGSTFSADASFTVLDSPKVIAVGALAPHTENPVIGDPGVAPESIDSRAAGGEPIPDPDLHTVSIADAIEAGHPALVVFSTPVYCVSRFCGPVTDMVAELAKTYGDRADFIHVEIYRDFQANELNEVARDWLMTPEGDLREPWTFLIGADGRIAASWDTVVTRGEIEPLLEALPTK